MCRKKRLAESSAQLLEVERVAKVQGVVSSDAESRQTESNSTTDPSVKGGLVERARALQLKRQQGLGIVGAEASSAPSHAKISNSDSAVEMQTGDLLTWSQSPADVDQERQLLAELSTGSDSTVSSIASTDAVDADNTPVQLSQVLHHEPSLKPPSTPPAVKPQSSEEGRCDEHVEVRPQSANQGIQSQSTVPESQESTLERLTRLARARLQQKAALTAQPLSPNFSVSSAEQSKPGSSSSVHDEWLAQRRARRMEAEEERQRSRVAHEKRMEEWRQQRALRAQEAEENLARLGSSSTLEVAAVNTDASTSAHGASQPPSTDVKAIYGHHKAQTDKAQTAGPVLPLAQDQNGSTVSTPTTLNPTCNDELQSHQRDPTIVGTPTEQAVRLQGTANQQQLENLAALGRLGRRQVEGADGESVGEEPGPITSMLRQIARERLGEPEEWAITHEVRGSGNSSTVFEDRPASSITDHADKNDLTHEEVSLLDQLNEISFEPECEPQQDALNESIASDVDQSGVTIPLSNHTLDETGGSDDTISDDYSTEEDGAISAAERLAQLLNTPPPSLTTMEMDV